jgi:predicted enzyme related to lactoylglutathione lyase
MFSHVSFTSVPVDDIDRAIAFYRDRLGMTVVADAPNESGRWVLMEVGHGRTQVHLDDRPDRVARRGRVVLALIAEALDDVVEALRDDGVEVLGEIKSADWNPLVSYTLIRDSEGNLILVSDG